MLRIPTCPVHFVATISLCLLLTACATDGVPSNAGREGAASTVFEYALAETYALPPSGTIHLSSEDADVSIAGSDRRDVRVEAIYRITAPRNKLAGFTYRLHVEQAGDDLRVIEDRRTGTRNFPYELQAHTIKIEVPEDAHVVVREEDGTCTIVGVHGRIEITMDDGDARLENCAGEIAVSLDGGTLREKNCAAVTFTRR